MVENPRLEHFAHLFAQVLIALDEIVGGDGLQIGEIDRRPWAQGDDLCIDLRAAQVELLALDQVIDVEVFKPCLLCLQILDGDGPCIGIVGNFGFYSICYGDTFCV